VSNNKNPQIEFAIRLLVLKTGIKYSWFWGRRFDSVRLHRLSWII